MPILPIDNGRYGSKEMKSIFEECKKLNYELRFEAAVAEAQAKVSIIPQDAATEITEIITSNKISLNRVKDL
jgi:adenylosuccinate lyase